jgi:hypothetical protein
MKIMMLKDDSVELTPTISASYPEGWVGEVPDAEGERLVKRKSARDVNAGEGDGKVEKKPAKK